MRVQDTVAVVSGGASGLGEGAVRMLAAGGGRTAILDLPGSRGAAIADERRDGSTRGRGSDDDLE